MKLALLAPLLLAVPAAAFADPVKVADHTVDFTPPAKWKANEDKHPDSWMGFYTPEASSQSMTVAVDPHKLDKGPLDLAKKLETLGLMTTDLEPDGKPTATEANGYVAMSQKLVSKDKSHIGLVLVVDAGAITVAIVAAAPAKGEGITKATKDILSSITVDTKKGPAIYPKK